MKEVIVNVYHQEIWITYWSYTYYKTDWDWPIDDRHADIYYKWKCVGERTPDCISRSNLWFRDSVVDYLIVKSIKELEEEIKKAEEYVYVRF